MSQPCPLEPSRDPRDGDPGAAASAAAAAWPMPGLVLGALDIGLAVQLGRAIGTVVALTWLLLEGTGGGERGNFFRNRAQNLN